MREMDARLVVELSRSIRVDEALPSPQAGSEGNTCVHISRSARMQAVLHLLSLVRRDALYRRI